MNNDFSRAALVIGMLLIAGIQLRAQMVWRQTTLNISSSAAPVAAGPDGAIYAVIGTTLMRSSDNGGTWSVLLAEGDTISSIVVSPVNEIFVSARSRGIKRSTDNGATWTTLPHFAPADGYAKSLTMTHAGSLLAVTIQGAAMHSTDRGESWKKVLTMTFMDEFVVDSVGTIFTSGGHDTSLFYSMDDGLNWTRRENHIPERPRSLHAYSDGHLFVAGAYSAVSTDRGASWRSSALRDVERVVAHPSGVLVAITRDEGIHRSTDGGITWQPSTMDYQFLTWRSSLPPSLFALTPGGEIIAGMSDSGLVRSADAGATWSRIATVLQSFKVLSIDHDIPRGILYARVVRLLGVWGDGGEALLRSTDGGEHWEKIFNQVGSNLAIGPEGTLYMAHGGRIPFISVSADHGDTWGSSGTGTEHNISYVAALPSGRVIKVMSDGRHYYDGEMHDKGPQSLMLGNARGAVVAFSGQRSTDNGATWSSTTGLPAYIMQMVADAGGTFFALVGNYKIYRSVDDGASWELVPGELPIKFPTVIAVTPEGMLHMAPGGGEVYAYDQGLQRWERRVEPLPGKGEAEALVALPGAAFVMGSSLTGIYRASVVASAPWVSEKSMLLSGPSPQPTSGMTEIRFTLPVPGRVRGALHDMRGTEVALLLDERREAGEQTVRFDASALPSGLYLCRIISPGGSSQAMVVVAR